jgi:hypothetical protein
LPRSTELDSEKRSYPGGYFDPLGELVHGLGARYRVLELRSFTVQLWLSDSGYKANDMRLTAKGVRFNVKDVKKLRYHYPTKKA